MATLAPVPKHRRGRPARSLVIMMIAAMMVAELIVVVLLATRPAGQKVITHTRTVAVASATAREFSQAGAVAAFEHITSINATGCGPGLRCYPPNAYPLAAVGGSQWELGYRVTRWAPPRATVQGWYVNVSTQQQGESAPNTVLTSGLTWGTNTINLRWTGHQWTQQGIIDSPNGPTPPADSTQGPASQRFAQQINGYYRFPGAP